MASKIWFAFVAASAVLPAIPGPTVVLRARGLAASPRAIRIVNRAGGTALIGAGAAAALSARAA